MRRKATVKIVYSSSPDQTVQAGKQFATHLRPGDVVLLVGTLGSGKTCFVQGLAQGLHITQSIHSPTYVYVHPYKGKQGNFYHIDLYRVPSIEKLQAIGVEDLLFDGSNIMAIEWPQLILQHYDCLSFRRIFSITFTRQHGDKRKIKITLL